MGYWEAGFGGTYGGSYRIRVQADVVAQEEDNNRSLVQYSAWVDRISSSGGRIYNYGTTYGNTNINGYNPQRALGSYDSSTAGRIFTMASNEQYWVGHDAAGNANPFFGANYDPSNSPYWTSGSTGGNMSLPGLYRYAAPTAIYFNNITDVGLDFRVVTNRVVDIISVQINGGAWQDFAGATTDRTMTFSNLSSDTVYDFRISLRRQSSGLWQEHGNWSTTTAQQNKFFDLGDF